MAGEKKSSFTQLCLRQNEDNLQLAIYRLQWITQSRAATRALKNFNKRRIHIMYSQDALDEKLGKL
jgi:hypothetical protein